MCHRLVAFEVDFMAKFRTISICFSIKEKKAILQTEY